MIFWRILKSATLLTSFLDNTAGVVARRSTFTRKDQNQYLLPVVVTDSGSPALSSTSTLTISVCSCQPAGHCPTGGVKTLALSMGISLQTLLGLVVYMVILIGKHPCMGQFVLHLVIAQNISLWYNKKKSTFFFLFVFGVWSLHHLASKSFQGSSLKRVNAKTKVGRKFFFCERFSKYVAPQLIKRKTLYGKLKNIAEYINK